MKPLKILLLGQFEVFQNDQELSQKLWQSRQIRAILKILVSARGKPVSSSQIIEIIWPEEDQKSAQQHLYVRISQLRKLLNCGDDTQIIQKVPGGYLFGLKNSSISDPDNFYQVDVDQFEKLADQARQHLDHKQFRQAMAIFETARDIYRADYLIEDIYEDWTMGERERLRDRYLILLMELAETYAQLGFYRRAINTCRQILSIEPCREAVYVRLMLYYYYAGEKGKALQIYDQCSEMLAAELNVPPDRSTKELAKQISTGTLWSQNPSPLYPPPNYKGRLYDVPYSLSNLPFTGRDRDLNRLIHHWQKKPNSVFWIEGEAGIGKTRLVEEFTSFVVSKGKQVIRLHFETQQTAPYQIWINLLKDYNAIFSKEWSRSKTFETLKEFLGGDENPLKVSGDLSNRQTGQIKDDLVEIIVNSIAGKGILWLDDAHLVPETTLKILSELLGKLPLLIGCRTEDTPQSHPLRELVNTSTSELFSLTLSRLHPADLENLVEKLSHGKPGVLINKLYEKTLGNPLFLIASIQHLFEIGSLYVDSKGIWQAARPYDHDIPPTIEEIITLRLKQIAMLERRILDIIAVAGGGMDYELLQTVMGIDENMLIRSADELIASGFLIEPREIGFHELAFSHNLYQELLYKSLPKARRKIYHRQLGEAMLSKNMDSQEYAGTLANHFNLGGDIINTFKFAKRAGDYSLRLYAPQEALTQYQIAASLADQVSIQDKELLLAQLWMGIGEALRLSGEYQKAGDYYQKALPNLQGELKQAAAYQLFQLNVFQGESLNSYDDMTAGFEEELMQEGDSWALALYYWASAFVLLMRGKQKETRKVNANGWRVARRLESAGNKAPYWVIQRALTTLQRCQLQWCNYQTSINLGNRFLSLLNNTVENEDSNNKAAALNSLGNAYYNLSDYQQAVKNFQTCHDLALKAGDPRLQAEGLTGLGWTAYDRGNLKAAIGYANQALNLAKQQNDVIREINVRLLLIQISLIKLDSDIEVNILENFLTLARFQHSDPYISKILLLLTECCLTLNRLDDAEAFAEEALLITERCGLKRNQSSAHRLLSLVRHQTGHYGSAFDHANQAVKIAKDINTPFELGLALSNRSSLVKEFNQKNQDVSAAMAIFDSIGAAYQFERIKKRLNLLEKNTEIN